MSKVGLCAPWVEYYKKINALFEKDPEINIEYDQENYEIKLYVNNQIKADALTQLLPTEQQFGNITLKVTVVPADNTEENRIDLFRRAFHGNPIVDLITAAGPIGYDFVIFAKEVAQYYNDDLTDAYGYKSTLYQDIAADIFGLDGKVFFSTTVPESNE